MSKAAIAGLALCASAPALAAQPAAAPARLVLEPAAMLVVADRLEAGGRSKDAELVLRALLSDPDAELRAEARYRLAQLLRRNGAPRAAAVELRRLADDKPGAVNVRLALAQLLADLGDEDSARRELRALGAARLTGDTALLVDRFAAALRASKPWAASLEIAVAPDSNINRATRSDVLGTVIGDFRIDEDGQARSGVGLAVKAQAQRRFALGEDGGFVVRAGGRADLYRAGEFNDLAADLSAGPQLRLGRGQVELGAGLTQRWFGRRPFLRAARIAASFAAPLDARTRLRLDGTAASIDNMRNDLQDGRAFSAQASLERALSPTTAVAVSLGGERYGASDAGYSTWGWRAGLAGRREVGRATFTASAEYGRLRADERLILLPDRRSDRFASLSLGATFRKLGVAGFAPTVRLAIERNRSSVEFHDYRRTRTELGLARAF